GSGANGSYGGNGVGYGSNGNGGYGNGGNSANGNYGGNGSYSGGSNGNSAGGGNGNYSSYTSGGNGANSRANDHGDNRSSARDHSGNPYNAGSVLYVRVDGKTDARDFKAAVAAMKFFSGSTPVCFYNSEDNTIKKMDRSCRIKLNKTLIDHLYKIFGYENVKMGKAAEIKQQ
ncbi:MAG: hypothetical protein FWH55_13255, partial [Oscillospiraceae bacterium]|nr:hypothetical protein [Oscillospiraceae bacterium]